MEVRHSKIISFFRLALLCPIMTSYLMIKSKISYRAPKRQAAAQERYMVLQQSQPFEGQSMDQVYDQNVLVQNGFGHNFF